MIFTNLLKLNIHVHLNQIDKLKVSDQRLNIYQVHTQFERFSLKRLWPWESTGQSKSSNRRVLFEIIPKWQFSCRFWRILSLDWISNGTSFHNTRFYFQTGKARCKNPLGKLFFRRILNRTLQFENMLWPVRLFPWRYM